MDFKRGKFDVAATVERLEYDPTAPPTSRSIKYADGEQAYILAPQRLTAGDTVMSGRSVDVKPGNAMPLGAMPVGTIVHNIETKPGKGGQLARAAGTYAMLPAATRAMRSSSSSRAKPAWCDPTAWRRSARSPIPITSTRSSARPDVPAGGANARSSRGIATQPVDHPKRRRRTNGGKHWATPWGKPTKGKKTRNNKSTEKFILRSRHTKKAKG